MSVGVSKLDYTGLILVDTGVRINEICYCDLLLPQQCSEISCNVKLNVYLAMEIPDHVSFVSGQNSDEIVRSCELS